MSASGQPDVGQISGKGRPIVIELNMESCTVHEVIGY
jgi:hypothetical protein